MTASAWTEARIERLKTLWLEGRTAEQIATELQNGISRSAVLGKVHRMRLSEGRPKRPRTSKAGSGPSSGSTGISLTDAGLERPPDTPATQDLGAPAPARPLRGPDIVSVRRGQCRWPYDDPGETFILCGRPVVRGSYCARHAAIGYRTPPGGAAALLTLAGLN